MTHGRNDSQKYFTSDLHDEIDADEFVALCIFTQIHVPKKCKMFVSGLKPIVLFGQEHIQT